MIPSQTINNILDLKAIEKTLGDTRVTRVYGSVGNEPGDP